VCGSNHDVAGRVHRHAPVAVETRPNAIVVLKALVLVPRDDREPPCGRRVRPPGTRILESQRPNILTIQMPYKDTLRICLVQETLPSA
jgi:hypothetical protein